MVGLFGACLEHFELGNWQTEEYSEMLATSVGRNMYDSYFHTIKQGI